MRVHGAMGWAGAKAGFLGLVLAGGGGVRSLDAAEPVSFCKDIAPLLLAKCVSCHGPEKRKGQYRLDTFEHMGKPGGSGDPPVVAGFPEKSLLYQLLTETDEDSRMPQKDEPLSAEALGMVRAWIEEGGRFDGKDSQSALALLAWPMNHPGPPATYPFPVPVKALAFSPGGQELMAGGYGEVTVWDPGTGMLLRRLTNLAERIQSLAFHPTDHVLAVGGGWPGRLGEIRLIRPSDGSLVRLLDRLPDLVMSVRYSPDGLWLAAAAADNGIHLYSTTNSQKTFVIEQHADWVMDLAFSPEGNRLVSASRDKSCRVFTLPTGSLESSYLEHDGPVFAVIWAADGSHVWSGGRDTKLHYWAVQEAKKVVELGGYDEDVCGLLGVGEGVVTSSGDGKIRFYSPGDKPRQEAVMEGHREAVYGLAYDAVGRRLASGSHDGEVRIWNVEERKVEVTFLAAP